MSEVKNIPRLRFKDYNGNDFPDWEEKRLGDVLNYEQPTKYLVDSTDYSDSYDLPVLTAGKSFILGYTNETTGVYFNLPTIIFDDFTTSFHYVDFEFKMKSSAMKMLTVKSNNYNLKLVFEIMKNLRFVLSEHKRYWISEYSQMFISIPSLPEQQKIADFLTAVDKRIELLEKKKTLLETYKKGVMKKIFNQEIRFKDDNGNDFPDWEEKKLGDITYKKSSNISANSIESNEGNYTIYGATGELKEVDFFEMNTPYISIVKDGSGVGRVKLCKPYSSVLGTLDIITNNETSDLNFIYQFLTKTSFLKYVTGSSIPHIYYKDYSKLKLSVPSIKEQIKISKFLSSIDNQIGLLVSQIDKSKTWKKGLLQKMFV